MRNKMNHCKIYIDCLDRLEEVNSILSNITLNLSKSNILIFATAYKNDVVDRDVEIGKKIYPTEVEYYVEVNSTKNCQPTDFQYGVVQLIIELRKYYPYVVASCDFEDFVIEKTGWNWTEKTPFPQL